MAVKNCITPLKGVKRTDDEIHQAMEQNAYWGRSDNFASHDIMEEEFFCECCEEEARIKANDPVEEWRNSFNVEEEPSYNPYEDDPDYYADDAYYKPQVIKSPWNNLSVGDCVNLHSTTIGNNGTSRTVFEASFVNKDAFAGDRNTMRIFKLKKGKIPTDNSSHTFIVSEISVDSNPRNRTKDNRVKVYITVA